MQHMRLFIGTIIFFLVVNTTYYWESKMGMFAMVTSLLLALYFLILTVLLLQQTYFSIREKLKNRPRLLLIGVMTVVLSFSIIYPSGLINYSRFESNSVLIAQREGAANCKATLKLRADKTFIERNVCFGVSETTGTYKVKGDTIFFENILLGRHEDEYYKFAVIGNREIENKEQLGDIIRYLDHSDTTGTRLWIVKNYLTKR